MEEKKFNEESNNENKSKNGIKVAIIVIIFLILVILILASYIFLNEKDTNNKNNEETKEENKETGKAEETDKKEEEKEDESNKEDDSSDDEQKEEEISFNEVDVNKKLNDTFSGMLVHYCEGYNNGMCLDDATNRIEFLRINYEKAGFGNLEDYGESQLYTTESNLKKVYKAFYGSLDNYYTDLIEANGVTIADGSVYLNNLGGESALDYKLTATKLVYDSKKDVYILSGTYVQTCEEAFYYNEKKYFVLEYKKANGNNYIVSFDRKSSL